MKLIKKGEGFRKYQKLSGEGNELVGNEPLITSAIITVQNFGNFDSEEPIWKATTFEESSNRGEVIDRYALFSYDDKTGKLKERTISIYNEEIEGYETRVTRYNHNGGIIKDVIIVSVDDDHTQFHRTNLDSKRYLSSDKENLYTGKMKEDSIVAKIALIMTQAETRAKNAEEKPKRR